jgi:hypothetical protein
MATAKKTGALVPRDPDVWNSLYTEVLTLAKSVDELQHEVKSIDIRNEADLDLYDEFNRAAELEERIVLMLSKHLDSTRKTCVIN